MSEFVLLIRGSVESRRESMSTPERAQKSLQSWRSWLRDIEAKGQLKGPGAPLDATGKVVRGKSRAISDGPHAESKEVVFSLVLVEARDLSHAIEIASTCPALDGGGAIEVRPTIRPPA